MTAIASKELSQLTSLDRRLLYVFVTGPGIGESIAVALPGRGWLMVDCCKVDGLLPQFEIFNKFRSDGDSIVAVLTHPHDDHADGFAELIAKPHTQRIGITGTGSSADLSASLQAIREAAATTYQKMIAGSVQSAVAAIEDWRAGGREILALCRGSTIQFADSAAVVACCSPDLASVPNPVELLPKRANEISLVLEICFGSARIVLGGDLPWCTPNGGLLQTGWHSVLENHPNLCHHTGLKVPHHGSLLALEPRLLQGPSDRPLSVTPYARSGLPRPEGLQLLIDGGTTMLTSPSASWERPNLVHPGLISFTALKPRAKVADPLLAKGADVRPLPTTVWGPIWATAHNEHGVVEGRWRGDAALEIQS